MLNIVYLTYQTGYDFATDNLFQKWVQQVDNSIHVGFITVVDNFDTQRNSEIFNWQSATVNVVAGDNMAREFSGYQRGLSSLQCHEGLVLILNDTFLSQKHHPWTLLLPGVIKMGQRLQKMSHNYIVGEVNNGPIGATFDGKSATWISTYCMLFSSIHLSTVQAAICEAMKVFHGDDTKFNCTFTKHIDRQIVGLPSSKNSAERLRKFQATAAEMSLSRTFQSTGLAVRSIYAIDVSLLLFVKHAAVRIIRKILFVTKN